MLLPVLRDVARAGFEDRARSEALSGLSAKERDKLMSLLERVHGNLVELVGDRKRKEAA